MEKISVIVPVYKVEKYLRKCLDNIVNQTYSNLEIIVVDDGSPDNSGNIADEYAAKDNRVKVIHKENGGLSDARNTGLAVATGEYVTFCDSDDIPDVREYEVLYNLIKKYDADISFCELQRFCEGDEIIKSEEEFIDKEITKNEAFIKVLMDGNVGNYVWIKLFKRDLFEGVEFPKGRTYEDIATIYKAMHKANKIAYTNEKLYYYLVGRTGAITSNYTEKKVKDAVLSYYEQYKFLAENYPEVKEYASLIFAKMFASASEKMCMNEFWDLYESAEIEEMYKEFKNAMTSINNNFLLENLETYRVLSVIALKQGKEIYKSLFDIIYKVKIS